MAEEVEAIFPDDSFDVTDTVSGNPNQNEPQVTQGVEEKRIEVVEEKVSGGAVVSGEEEMGKGEIDTSTDGSSEKGEMKKELEEKVAPSNESEVKEVVEEEEVKENDEPEEGKAEGEEPSEEDENEGEVPAKEEVAGSVSAEAESGVTKKGEEAEEETLVGKLIASREGFFNKLPIKFNKKWIIFGSAAFMLIVVLVAFLIVPNLLLTDTGEVKSLEEIAGPVYKMKFFLPLAVGSGRPRFIKVTIAIELVDKGFKKEIDEKISELRKEVIDLVLGKSPKEIKSASGKSMLRKEITARLNNCLTKKYIKNTYFMEMVVL